MFIKTLAHIKTLAQIKRLTHNKESLDLGLISVIILETLPKMRPLVAEIT